MLRYPLATIVEQNNLGPQPQSSCEGSRDVLPVVLTNLSFACHMNPRSRERLNQDIR